MKNVRMYVHKDRVSYLQEALPGKVFVTIPEIESSQLLVELGIEDDYDIMAIFHAGINYGLQAMSDAFLKKA